MENQFQHLPRDFDINESDWPQELLQRELPLHLFETRTSNILRQSGKVKVGAFLTTDWQIYVARQLGAKSRAELQKHQDAMGRTPESVTDWFHEIYKPNPRTALSANCMASALRQIYYPQESELSFTDEKVLILPLLLPALVRKIVDVDDRSWGIFVRREEIEGSRVYTLDELKFFYNVSRERVRQIHTASRKRLSVFLQNGSLRGMPEKIHPAVLDEIEQVYNWVCTREFPLPDSQIWPQLSQRYGIRIEAEMRQHFSILFSVLGLFSHEVTSSTLKVSPEKVWMKEQNQKQGVDIAIRTVTDLLRKSAQAISGFDLLIEVNRNLRKSGQAFNEAEINSALSLHRGLEHEGNSYRMCFAELPTNELRAERVLQDNANEGKLSMSVAEIVSEINYHHAQMGQETDASSSVISGACAASPNIINIGAAGGWTLKHIAAQNNIETREIYLLMAEALRLHRSPMTLKEIHNYVSALRPVKGHTVNTLLPQHPQLFVRYERGVWALCEWNLSEAPPMKRGKEFQKLFDDALIDIFAESGGCPLTLSNFVRKARENLGWKETSVRQYVKKSLWLDTKKGDGEAAEVHLRDDSKKVVLKERDSKRGRVQKLARTLLNDAKGTVSSPLLVSEIHKKTRFHTSVIYNSLANMADVEKFGEPGEFFYRLSNDKRI